MVPLDGTTAGTCTLSVVTMSLSAAVWPKFATQLFGYVAEVYVTLKVTLCK